MGEFKDPFSDLKQDKVVAKEKFPEGIINTASIIRRLAEIEDELSRRGIDPLEKEKTKLKKTLKDYMLKYEQEMAYDETSGWEATLIQRSSDVWDVDALKDILSTKQKKRYIAESVHVGAVEAGIKSGDLKRPSLEKAGAVVRNPGSKALYVRARKEENDEEDA